MYANQTTVYMCMVGKLAGGVSVAVAVGVSDRKQVTCDTLQLTVDS